MDKNISKIILISGVLSVAGFLLSGTGNTLFWFPVIGLLAQIFLGPTFLLPSIILEEVFNINFLWSRAIIGVFWFLVISLMGIITARSKANRGANSKLS